MSFLSPLMLWAAVGAGLPVIIHLASRSKPDVVPLPTVMFLSRAKSAQSARLKLKQILLLAMRMAAIGLFALILSRPCSGLFALPAEGGRLRGPGVVVLDCSYSMAYRDGERSRFDLAREAAGRILGMFDEEAEVALVLAGDRPRSMRSRPTIDHRAVKGELASASLVWEGADLGDAIALAEKMLSATGGRARTAGRGGSGAGAVFVVTDMTRAAWSRSLDPPGAGGHGDAPAAAVHVIDVSRAEAANGAVTSVELPSRRMAAGGRAELAAGVLAKRGVSESLVELLVDGDKVDQVVVAAAGGRYAEAGLVFTAPAAGVHRGEVRLVDVDALGADNSRHFVFSTGGVARCLLVEGAAGGAARADRGSLYYVDKALAPDSLLGAAPVATARATAAELETSPLAGFDCVILGEAGALSADSWGALSRYVDGGGGLLVALGPGSRLDELRAHDFDEFSEGTGLLPGTIGEAVVSDEAVALAPKSYAHPVLRIFRGGSNGRLDAASFTAYVRLSVDGADSHSRVVLPLSNGEPALVEKRFGRGAVMVFASSLGAEWGTLPGRLAFVPLVHQIVRYISPSPGELGELEVGEPASIPAPGGLDGAGYEVLAPSRRWRAVDLADAKSVREIRTPPLDEPGIWRVRYRRAGEPGEAEHLIAVNLSGDESDLDAMAPEELAAVLGDRGRVHRSLDEFARLAAEGGVEEVTAWLWPLLMLLLVVEAFAANRLYRPVEEKE